jgi:hypothetical protein
MPVAATKAARTFRAGECALFTESSAGYAGISSEAQFDFEVAIRFLTGARLKARRRTPSSVVRRCGSCRARPRKNMKGVAAFFNFLSSSTDPGQVAPGHRLSADHHGGLR